MGDEKKLKAGLSVDGQNMPEEEVMPFMRRKSELSVEDGCYCDHHSWERCFFLCLILILSIWKFT